MAEVQGQERQSMPARGDARDLQARLYREIGLLAVAAALEIRLDSARKTASTDTLVAPEREKRAA
jgi:hypothetical protein